MIAYSLTTLVFYLAICVYLANHYVSPSRWTSATPPELRDAKVGETPVWASPQLLESKPVKGVFVLAHGYGGSRTSWRTEAIRLTKDGYGVVVPAMPGHDASPDKTCGFGTKESKIVAECARWARARLEGRPEKIVAVGVSMGGAGVWLASAQEPTIDAVVTDSAFAQFDEATNDWFRRLFPGAVFVLAPVRWMAQAMTGIDPASIRPIDAAAKWKGKPALVIHGDSDKLIPRSNAARLAEASGSPIWIVPHCGHAEASSEAREEYIQRLESIAHELVLFSNTATLRPHAHL